MKLCGQACISIMKVWYTHLFFIHQNIALEFQSKLPPTSLLRGKKISVLTFQKGKRSRLIFHSAKSDWNWRCDSLSLKNLSLSLALNFFPVTFPNLRTTLQSPDIKPLSRIIAMWVPRLIILIWMLCFEGFSYNSGKERIRPCFYKDHISRRTGRLGLLPRHISNTKKWPQVEPK